jgi:hypothetical protein
MTDEERFEKVKAQSIAALTPLVGAEQAELLSQMTEKWVWSVVDEINAKGEDMTDGPTMKKNFPTPQDLEAMEQGWEPEYVPEDGWLPEAYPQLTVAPIPYTSQAADRADPFITITAAGWMFIEVGNIRIALPDREEWDKLVGMGERMWNSWQANRQPQPDPTSLFDTPTPADEEPSPPPSGVQEATAAAIGGIVASKSFEDMIHRATQQMADEGDNDDPDPAH